MRLLLPLIEAQLARVTGLDATAIRPWIGEASPHLAADHDLVLRLKGFSPEGEWQEGSGRYAMVVRERLEVGVRTRLALDEPGSARDWLEDAVLGHLVLRDAVVNGMLLFLPLDGDGNSLTAGAVRLAPGQAPRQDAGRAAAATDWGEERLSFDIPYAYDVTLPEA